MVALEPTANTSVDPDPQTPSRSAVPGAVAVHVAPLKCSMSLKPTANTSLPDIPHTSFSSRPVPTCVNTPAVNCAIELPTANTSAVALSQTPRYAPLPAERTSVVTPP